MIKNRFFPVQEYIDILKKQDELKNTYKEHFYNHCRVCGDTNPKHGFYPLFSGAFGGGIYQTSSLMCNRCALSDEDYLKTFKEPKEQI